MKPWFIVFWRGENPPQASLDDTAYHFDTTTDHYLPEGWSFKHGEEPEDPLADLVDESVLVTDTGLQVSAEWLHYADNGDVWVKHPDGFEYNLGKSIDTEAES